MSSPLGSRVAWRRRVRWWASMTVLLSVTAACGSREARPVLATKPADAEALGRLPAQLATALTLLGTPYRDGGSTPRGFDCSGFVQYVFGAHGHRLPRTTAGQYVATQAVERRVAMAGDLVFFRTTSRGPSHVGILIDGTQFVHAPARRGVVRVEPLDLPYWTQRLIGFRRVRATPPAAGSTVVARP